MCDSDSRMNCAGKLRSKACIPWTHIFVKMTVGCEVYHKHIWFDFICIPLIHTGYRNGQMWSIQNKIHILMFQTKVINEIKTPILCSMIFLPKIVLFDIMWKNMVVPKKPEITIWAQKRCSLPATELRHNYRHRLIIFNTFPCQQ